MFDAMTFVLSLIDKRQFVPFWLLTWGNSTLVSLSSEISRCFFDFVIVFRPLMLVFFYFLLTDCGHHRYFIRNGSRRHDNQHFGVVFVSVSPTNYWE